ncbi:MAG: GIY-YIG nuclease family protein [Bacteroidales bacterium]|nr:GIY-YIG nuclease family protein [Bacteroidales bacterium]MDY0216093.1 GIY-YIG nuclease family protein [Bacteroidales bacterium]
MNNYYVYVYIDPRNFEEFYYGKGKGSRKEAHLKSEDDSEKTRIIKEIQKEGLQPIIKVIARNLSESEALLVEKTLIWKLGKSLTNVSPGHFADNFRPHNKYHLNLSGFDFEKGLFYVNVGEGEHRCWEDCTKYGFLSAGQDKKWSDPIRTLNQGDIVVAYLKNNGYVGIGRVIEKAVPVNSFNIDNKSLREFDLKIPNIFENSDNEKSEFLVKIEWICAVEKSEAKWKKNSKLFTTQLIKASLDNQFQTIDFIQKEFGINIHDKLINE